MNKYFYTRALLAMATIVMVNAVWADQNAHEGYLLGTNRTLVMNNYHECWKTSSWTPGMAIAECDSSLVKVAAVEAPMAPPQTKPQVFVLTLESDTLFEFDKSVISARGKQQLDNQVIAKMNQYPQIELVQITGHADRIGPEAYNQKLSQRRADAVRDYLVAQGIVSSRTETASRGESDPVVSCAGSKSAKLIECLRPNRRVVVEIKTMQ